MTNLEIIKYLSLNNPARFAELLEDIYCCALNDGANNRSGDDAFPEFDKWLYEDASVRGLYYDHELEQWYKMIFNHTIEATYSNGLAVELPYKDPTWAWNTNNDYEVKSYPEKENK